MLRLRPSARLYILTLCAVAFGLTGYYAARVPTLLSLDALLAALSIGLVAVAVVYPLHFKANTRFSLESSIIFAAVLLFEPGLAMLVALVGSLLGDAVQRRARHEAAFNAAQTALQAGAGSLILSIAGWRTDELVPGGPLQLLAVLAAAAAMHLVNTLSVASMVGLQSGPSPLHVWRRSIGFDAVEQLSQFALGFLGAIVAGTYLPALPLLLLPAYAIHRSLERHVQLRRQTLEAVESLADIVDIRDPYTANHSRRVSEVALQLATELGLPSEEVDLIERAARVHDVGKVIVDASVLAKPGRLTDDEWEQLRRHPVTGADILGRLPQFALATSYVRHHHERMDGRGYPDAIRAERIPLGARIIAVADSFDAMTSARPYRQGLPREVVLAELARERGAQWDARVVDALLNLLEQGRVSVPPSEVAKLARTPVHRHNDHSACPDGSCREQPAVALHNRR